jgi:hypothetical protein
MLKLLESGIPGKSGSVLFGPGSSGPVTVLAPVVL